jgi:nucleoid DNA-binding protein
MTQLEFVRTLNVAADLSKPEAGKAVNLFFNETATALSKGEQRIPNE